jgi:hypothetical protein
MWVTLLFTVLSLLASVTATIMAHLARESAASAKHSEHRLAIMRGQVAGLEAAMMGFDEKFKKLAGRVYADEYWRGKSDRQPELQPSVAAGFDSVECGNWAIAQREGPTSEAARCECSYCEAKRADRAARRAKLRTGVKS